MAGLSGLLAAEREGFRGFARSIRGGLDLKTVLIPCMLPDGFAAAHPEAVEEVLSWDHAKSAPLLADELEAFASGPDLTPRLPELDVPILARVGDQDVSTPLSHSEAIVRAARRGTLEVVPGVGHGLLLEDLPATLASVRRVLTGD